MTIIDNTLNLTAGKLKIGDTFKCFNDGQLIYILTHETDDDEKYVGAVRIDTGESVLISRYDTVYKVAITITVDYN